MVDNAAVGKNALLEQSSSEPKHSIKRDRASLEAIVSAIRKSSAIIEFNMDGTILDANENFLQAMGYNLHEIKGKPHSMFLPETYRNSSEYQEFWSQLKSGHCQSAELKRLGKGGREVWLNASYNPILNGKGQPVKVIKFATDITQQKLMVADYSGQIEAIGKSTAVIEFNMDGTIRTANGRFLSAMAYSLEEIEGKHHSIFVEQSVWNSREYREFWQKLKQGQFQQGEFKRLGKNGRQVWIQASYNPILDLNGEPVKVVKYATDVTRQKVAAVDFEGQIVAIGKSTAVVEFNMDGTIQNANDRFLSAMGYKLDEVLGKHHSMFVEPSFSNSREYREFWEKLNQGGYQQAEFKRLGKNGREVWIQASYNPILDLNGKPFKVVKYATDVTEHIAAKTDLQRKVEVILDVVKAASQGDLTRDIPVSGTDAIGQMGEGLRVFFQSLRHSIQQIHKNAESVGASAERLMKLSNQMAGDASETSGQARDVSRTSGEVSSNVSVLAAGGEEMLTSIRHIAANSTESARVAKEAVSAAENAKRIVFELGDSTAKIGNVLKLITSVAQQTNLLALNATIEAARAGEAGKGFAVVAHEVKELAKQTARATDEIGLKIEAIQAGTKGAVQAISQIDSVIKEIDGISASIASSIEQQTVTTNQMRRSVNEAALGATGIANGISGVAKNALNTVSAASETQNAAKALAQMAAQLQSLVVQFRC